MGQCTACSVTERGQSIKNCTSFHTFTWQVSLLPGKAIYVHQFSLGSRPQLKKKKKKKEKSWSIDSQHSPSMRSRCRLIMSSTRLRCWWKREMTMSFFLIWKSRRRLADCDSRFSISSWWTRQRSRMTSCWSMPLTRIGIICKNSHISHAQLQPQPEMSDIVFKGILLALATTWGLKQNVCQESHVWIYFELVIFMPQKSPLLKSPKSDLVD